MTGRGIEAVFWDNDGVLVDTESLYFEATRQILATIGIDLTEALYQELFLLQGRGAWHLAAERGFAPAEVERLRNARNDLYSQWLAEAPRLIDGVAAVVKALHGRYQMGVVTSSRKDHFDLIHAHTGLLDYFDFILTASDVTRVKPDPELYVRAIERAGVAPNACLAIEDSYRGLQAARAAGIRCVIVPTPLTRGAMFDEADAVFDRIEDVLTLFNQEPHG